MNLLNVTQVKYLASVSQELGKALFRELIGCSTEDDRRGDIYADFLYGSMVFGIEKGFPWEDVCVAVQLSAELHQATLNHPLAEAIQIVNHLAPTYSNQMSDRSLKLFTEYFFETYMKHYSLYRHVFREDQQCLVYKQHLTVEVLPPPRPLAEGQTPNVFQYEQKVAEVEQRRVAATERLRSNRPAFADASTPTQPSAAVDKERLVTLPQEEAIASIIADVVQKNLTPIQDGASHSISEVYESLGFKAEQMAIPRPKVLGPPPKFPLLPAQPQGSHTTSEGRPKSSGRSAKSPKASSAKMK